MGIHQLLAAAATAASPAAAAATQGSAFSAVDFAVNLGFIVWIALATLGLLKLRVFHPKTLRDAPTRTAVFLLPIAVGTAVLYFVFLAPAIVAGERAGLFPHRALQAEMQSAPPEISASTPAAASQSRTAPAPAAQSQPAPREVSSEQDMWIQACNTAAELAAAGVAIGLRVMAFRDGLNGIGLAPHQIGRGILLGILAYLVVFPLLIGSEFALQEIYQYFGHEMSTHQTIEMMEQTQNFLVKFGDCIIAGFAAPIAEEIFFRGIFQSALIQRPGGALNDWLFRRATGRELPPYRPAVYQRWLAIIITAAIFAAVHMSPDQFPILFLLAIGLGYLYERTGNLYACITLHALFNLTTLLQLLFSS